MKKKAIVVAGVSGCGKSTIGHALATEIGWPFLEADDFHSEDARAKMIAGRPLDDADRAPWLATLNAELLRRAPAVLACSALKQKYRERLSEGLQTRFVWIDLSRETAMQRVAGRSDHFMPASLVNSQFETAEVPEEAIFVSATDPVERSVQICSKALEAFISG
ncbi:MAG: gluconokinase [Woeseiaceae bacterium]|nr:gluconokinase [Woeseiaceae bacterium]